MDDSWGGAENIAMFDTMLKSILKPSSDLQKNWDVDLIKLCDTFLQKIRRAIREGCSYVDFVEAAMVVQSSAAVYARKVDYLWVQLEKLLITFRSNPVTGRRSDEAGQEPEHAGRDGEASRRGRRAARGLDTEDYDDVVLNLPDPKSINLKQNRGDDVEEVEEADYFIQDLMNNKEVGSALPLFDVHGDMIGNRHDFRMNRRLAEGLWLADSLPVFEMRYHPNTSGCTRAQEEVMEAGESPASTGDSVLCRASAETTQELAEEPVPSPGQRSPTPLPPEEPPPPATTPPPPAPTPPPPPSPTQGSEEVEISRAAMTRSATRRSLNVVDVTMVSQEELTKPCKDDIPDKPLVVHACVRPECVYCGKRHEQKKGRKECCKSEQEIESCLSGIEAMLLDDVIKPELTKLGGFQFNREFLLGLRKFQIRSIQEPTCLSDWTSYTLDDVKLMFEDDEEEDFRGFDLSLDEDMLQLCSKQVPPSNSDEEDAAGLDGMDVDQNEAEFPLSQGDVPLPVDVAVEQDTINSRLTAPPEPEFQYPAWEPDAANDADEAESRVARVAAWHDSLQTVLSGAEERSHVDIHEYGSRLLAAFPAGRARCTLSLQHILQGKPQEDTCRYFLSALMLANTCNVEISKSDDSDLAMDCVELTLLDRSRRHDLMEEECASITTSDRSRKRKKPVHAANQASWQPQNGPVETPLRESPNRINIMSPGSAFRGRSAPSHAGPSHRPAPGPAKCPGDPQPGPSWASDADCASDTSDSVDLSDVRTLGASKGKRRKV